MIDHQEPFVASLWKVGAPEEFAAEELTGADDWDQAKTLALEWPEGALSEGGLSHPTLLYLNMARGQSLFADRSAPDAHRT